jgi:hypothetical protein
MRQALNLIVFFLAIGLTAAPSIAAVDMLNRQRAR